MAARMTGARRDVRHDDRAAVRLIDVHTHTQPSAAAAARFVGDLGLPVNREGTTADLVASMDVAGIAWSMIVPLIYAQDEVEAAVAAGADRGRATGDVLERWHELNAWAARAAARQPDRLRAVVGVDPVLMPKDHLEREVREQLAAGASGIKIAPMFIRVRPDDERMEDVWRLAVEHDVPVLSECGASAFRGPEPFGSPAYFAPVVRSYPALRLQLAHLGMGAEDDMASIVRLSDTVVTDTAMRLGAGGGPFDAVAFTELIRRIGLDKVMFATNYPMIDQIAYSRVLRSLPLDDDELRQVGRTNAAAFWRTPA